MRRVISFRLYSIFAVCALLWLAGGQANAGTVRVTTWNLEWFPSGSPKPATPEAEAKKIQDVAKVIQVLNPDVLLLQEVRDWQACEQLAAAVQGLKYQVLVCSAFSDNGRASMSRQQVAILSKYPAQAAWSEPWKSVENVDPPRGLAFAVIRVGQSDIGFYAVHLKSNLAKSPEETQLNIAKREVSAKQLIEHAKAIQTSVLPGVKTIVVGGDFNTNHDEFVTDKTLATLEEAGFVSAFGDAPLEKRITHPADRFPACTFDHLYLSGATWAPGFEIIHSKLSDHLPVTAEFEVK